MWHTTEIADIMAKITNDYGYSVFKNRKLCVALCGDLFVKYEREKQIFQMLFQAGLGEVINDAPFKTEQELKIGLARVDSFLQKQAIEQEARIHVIEIMQKSFAKVNSLSGINMFQPQVTRSYNELHFRLLIPEVQEYADRIELSTKFMYKETGTDVDTVFEKAVYTDRVNDVHESQMDYCLLPRKKTRSFRTTISNEGNKIFLTDAVVEFTFLCSNYKKVIISYQIDKERRLKLTKISIYKMTVDEYEKTCGIINMLLKADAASKEEGKTEINLTQLSEEEPTYLSASIQEYSDALRREIHFLKMGRGKKYKIVNGAKINKDDKGIYTYSFELETELHLPDDAPVVIDTNSGFHAVGTVLVCEDFQILLLLDHDVGEKVLAAYLMVEPWKLLEALNKRITTLNPSIHKIAIALLEQGPKLSTTEDISTVAKGQPEVLRKLEQDNIVAVWGPPGTGKTYTMSQIAKTYVKQGKTVLIISHSNVSVDGVVKKIVELLDVDMEPDLKAGKILRYGYVRDEELSKHPYATSFNFALSKCKSLAADLDELTLKRDELKAKKKEKTEEYDGIEKKIKRIRNEIRKEEKRYAERAQLIGTTISRATIDSIFEMRQFDLVMFDEVSMAYVPQVIAAATLSKEKFICVGDFRQLAPISQCPDAKLLKTDIFSYLKIIDSVGHMYWHPWLVMLNEQRRMHPDIAGFPNKYIYKRLLQNHTSVLNSRKNIVKTEPLSGDALNLVNLAGTYCAADKNTDGSRFNILSAIISFSTAVAADQKTIERVGIITPYAAQTRLIRAMLKDYYKQNDHHISCATVHQFQGSEADLIVFDAVESYPKAAVGYLMGKEPDSIMRLINVAITRAKGKLITVANDKFWINLYKGTNHIFYKLLDYIKEGHKVVSNSEKTLLPYVEDVNPGSMMQIYTNEDAAIFMLENDLEKSKGRVVVSLPSSNLRETQGQIIQAIDDAHNRGIDIWMKSNEYSGLSDAWKRYCVGTENATFPLIVIDDEIAWYGLPTATWSFKVDKSSSLKTVLHVMVRIKGQNTIEMIKALTELEVIQVGVNKRPLSNKENSLKSNITEGQSIKSIGLAAFVEEKEFCPDCRSHMIRAKNQRGTAYLRCSNKNCKKMKYLTADLMNWYISNHNVECPKNDGGELKGILGKYGPCVKCSRGHFLKPEEI